MVEFDLDQEKLTRALVHSPFHPCFAPDFPATGVVSALLCGGSLFGATPVVVILVALCGVYMAGRSE